MIGQSTFIALLAALLLTPVAAGELALTLAGPQEPMLPGREILPVDVVVGIPCEAVLANLPAQPGNPEQLEFTIGPTHPSVSIAGVMIRAFTPEPCEPTTIVEVPHLLMVAVNNDAPGLEPLSATIHVALQPGPGRPDGILIEEGQADLEVTAAYVPAFMLESPAQLIRSETHEATIQVTNLGNAKTRIEFRVVEGPETGHILTPSETTLDSASSGGTFQRTMAV